MGWSSTLEVTTPAASQDLISLATFKEDHGLSGSTYDTLLGRMISRASRALAQACGRVFVAETVTETFRLVREAWDSPIIPGQGELILGRYPVVSVTSVVEEADAALATSAYALSKTSGIVLRLNDEEEPKPILWPVGKITVVYVAGFATIPADLEEAASMLVWEKFQARTQDRSIKSKFVDGVDRIEYFAQAAGGFSPEIQAVVDAYRTPVFR